MTVIRKALRMNVSALRILVVDDNVDTARMMQVLLKLTGYETMAAFDGHAGIQAAAAFKPDVAILDLALPGKSGFEVAKELRGTAQLAGCLLIAVSGFGAEELPSPSPFDHFFTKPVDHHALLKLLSEFAPPTGI